MREMDMDFEARARARRMPLVLMIMFVVFLTMGFDLESDWFASQRASRLSGSLLYDGESAKVSLSKQLDEIQQHYGNDTEESPKAVIDVAKTYKGQWCALEKNEEISLYPNVIDSKCGTFSLKISTGPPRREGSVVTVATMVLRDENLMHEGTLRLNGEYKTSEHYILLIGSLRDMFMRNNNRTSQGFSPYYPCSMRMFLDVQDGSSALALGGGNSSATSGIPQVGGEVVGKEGDGQRDSGHNTTDSLSLQGFIDSENCGWKLNLNATSIDMNQTTTKVTNYCFMMTAVALLQLVCLVYQVQQAANPGVSLFGLGQQAMIDAYLCLLHLTAGIVADSMFGALATAAFCEFVVFSMFEMRYLIACSHSRLGNQSSWFETQADIGTMYGRFYGLLLLGIVLIYELKENYWVLTFLFYSFWIPQIVRNAVQAVRRPLRPLYIIGMTCCRLVLPLYFFGCPQNFLKVPYSLKMCFMLVLYMAAQVGLLLLQYYCGSRCFIPDALRPERYNYFRKLNIAQSSELNSKVQEEGGIDCVICMTPVEYSSPSSRMVTPCNHFFHPDCLERWLKVKMECPTCRRPLPPADI